MSYALAVPPTPLRLFLARQPYVDQARRDNLSTVTERAGQICEHYYDQVTMTGYNELLKENFQTFVDDWMEATRFVSSLSEITNHPAYRAIVDLGQQAVPLLLRELETRPNFWFAALREMTGANPVPEKDRGNVEKMVRAWLRWGKEQGLRW